jgi:hypothetical protein
MFFCNDYNASRHVYTSFFLIFNCWLDDKSKKTYLQFKLLQRLFELNFNGWYEFQRINYCVHTKKRAETGGKRVFPSARLR